MNEHRPRPYARVQWLVLLAANATLSAAPRRLGSTPSARSYQHDQQASRAIWSAGPVVSLRRVCSYASLREEERAQPTLEVSDDAVLLSPKLPRPQPQDAVLLPPQLQHLPVLPQPVAALPTQSALVLLNVVACVWGSQHPIVKQCVEAAYAQSLSASAAAAEVNLGRFAIGALIFAPFLPPLQLGSRGPGPEDGAQRIPDGAAAASWRWGAELGVWMFLGFILQAVGLEYTSASRSAFLLYLNVKFVPIIARLVYKTPISATTWASALAAFTGTALLSSDGLALNVGDGWSILAALASAVFILRLEVASAATAGYAKSLNAVTLLVVCALCATWFTGIGISRAEDAMQMAAEFGAFFGQEWWSLLFLGVICTGLCNWAQTVGQRSIPAGQAAIVYATDPLWAAFFSWLALGETLGPRGWAGAVLIFTAAISTQIIALRVPEALVEGDTSLEEML